MKKLILFLTLLSFITLSSFAQETKKKSFCRCDTISIMQDTLDVSLIVYTPINSTLELSATRPDSNSNTLFCVPAAFTAKNYKEIVGKFVGKDTIINNPTEKENGICWFQNNKVYIGEIEDSLAYYTNALSNPNTYYFQQMLLIHNSTKIECTIFGKQKPTFRRALAIKNNRPYVVESLNRMNIGDFTDVMIQQGYTEAIYLDMGTWSEGFFIDKDNTRHSIGNLRYNTKHQTNWLLFSNK